MKYPFAILVAFCCFQLSSSDLQAQYGGYGGGGYGGGSYGGYGGGSYGGYGGGGYGGYGGGGYGGYGGGDCGGYGGGGYGDYTNPRTGYCLKNDCFRGGGGGCGGGCGGGGRIIVNVRVNTQTGEMVSQPAVQAYYPQCGCGGGNYGSQSYQTNPNTHFVRPAQPQTRTGVARDPASAQRSGTSRTSAPPTTKTVGYRYKF